jgi:hypothetical protein
MICWKIKTIGLWPVIKHLLRFKKGDCKVALVHAKPKGKTCTKCEEEKPFSEFRRKLISKDGFRNSCRSCQCASDKLYRSSHKEKRRAYQTLYRAKKYGNDPAYRLRCCIGTLIRGGFNKVGSSKNKRSLEILGCSFGYFSTYIENQFKEGMTLENYGEWELDHIVPQDLAITAEDVIALNHYSNFQPLFKTDNIRKSNKLILDSISPENKIRYKEIIERAQK